MYWESFLHEQAINFNVTKKKKNHIMSYLAGGKEGFKLE